MDEQHLYHWEIFNDWNYAKNDWAETDNAQFTDTDNFGSLDILGNVFWWIGVPWVDLIYQCRR